MLRLKFLKGGIIIRVLNNRKGNLVLFQTRKKIQNIFFKMKCIYIGVSLILELIKFNLLVMMKKRFNWQLLAISFMH